MMHGLSALAYLEYRQLANRIRQTAQQPGRAIVYVIALGYFVAVAFMRHQRPSVVPAAIPEPYASALFLAYVTLLGIMMYGAACGIVGAFSSPADARFLTGSLISQRLVIVWLQLRRCSASIARMIFTLLLYTLIFPGSGSFTGIGLAVIGGAVVTTVSAIPMLKLRRIIGTRTAQSLAGAVAAIGIFPMAILLASLPPNSTAHDAASSVERLGLGHAFNALFDANPLALIALYAFGALIVALSFAAGAGLYPELYAASMRVLAFRERQRHGTTVFVEHRYERRRAYASHRIFGLLRGPWTIVWKEWIAFMRSPSMRRMFVLGLVVCAGIGCLFGYITIGSKDALQQTIELASIAGNMIVIFVAMGSAIGLSSDIAKPLWWMGRDALWLRLLAWTVGASWRLSACLAVGIAAWAITLHMPVFAAAGIPIAISAVLYLRAVGLALYSLFPSTFDQRGPLAMVRALLTYLLAAPPGIAGVVALIMARSILAGLVAGIVCSLLETLLLVAFASSRIGAQGVALARAEAM
jgi:hypothetical protein